MYKKIEARQRSEGRIAAQDANRTDSPNCKPNALLTDEVLPDEEIGEGESQEGAEVLYIEEKTVNGGQQDPEEGEQQYQNTNLEVLLAAWWKYKRENKHKKKKRKALKLYRDENYWNDGKCTDEEDFTCYES